MNGMGAGGAGGGDNDGGGGGGDSLGGYSTGSGNSFEMHGGGSLLLLNQHPPIPQMHLPNLVTDFGQMDKCDQT